MMDGQNSERPLMPGKYDGMVDVGSGLVTRSIFFDDNVYRDELRTIFAKSWLYLGHESQLPGPGDFVTTFMGEDPVVVCRDQKGSIRAFLNSCRHRGMKLCRYDGGNTKVFQCPFHGWSYDLEGKLVGIPFHKAAYGDELKPEQLGLLPVTQVASYGGLIFATWDAEAVSLDEYLGEMRWYLDLMIERAPGGLEVIPGLQRYTCDANWKIASENFSGDTYHLPFSHKSLFMLDDVRPFNPVGYDASSNLYTVACPRGHVVTAIGLDAERFHADMKLAKELGPDVVEFVEENQRLLVEGTDKLKGKVYGLGFGNIFPNFSFNDFSALRPTGLYMWHPKGPGRIEAWQSCAVAKDAPEAIKSMVREDFSRVQSASGVVAQDDTENFEQVTEATKGFIGQELEFNYQMGLGVDEGEAFSGYPGRFYNYFSEVGQRRFYEEWLNMMHS